MDAGWLGRAFRRTAGIMAMLLGVVGILASGALLFGCWWFLSSVSQYTSQTMGRVESFLDATSDSFAQVRAS